MTFSAKGERGNESIILFLLSGGMLEILEDICRLSVSLLPGKFRQTLRGGETSTAQYRVESATGSILSTKKKKKMLVSYSPG